MTSNKHPKNTLKLTDIRKKNKEFFGDEYTISKRYFENGNQRLVVKHNKCGRIKHLLACDYFRLGKGQFGHCQFCNGGRPKTSPDKIQQRFYELNGSIDWELLEEIEPYIYPSNGLKQRQFKVIHKVCGYVSIKQTNNLCSRTIGCKKCAIEKRRKNVR